LKVDFHCHSFCSKDSLTRIPKLIWAARDAGLDKLVITDHNTIRGAQIAYAMAPDMIIIGEEIQTTAGELLAFFVKQEVPKGLEPLEAISRLRSQGAFISVSHPFDPYRSGWTQRQLEDLVPLVDAIEVFNARPLLPVFNSRAADLALAHNLPGTAGSDAHVPSEVGQAGLELPDFTGLPSLWQSIKSAKPVGDLSPFWVHFGSSWAKLVKAMNRREIELI